MPRFQPPANTISTGELQLTFEVPPADWEAEVAEAQAHTFEAIAWYRECRRDLMNRAKRTLDKDEALLTRLFREPLLYDPILERWRAPLLPELLRPDDGRRMLLHIARGLQELGGQVWIDLLTAFRAMANFLVDNSATLPSGVNLRKRWGPLVCPLRTGELPQRTRQREVFLPRLELMPVIYEAIYDWALAHRVKWSGWRTATATTLCFESGLRGAEARWLDFSDQLFDVNLGVAGLPNPLNVRSAKRMPPRQAKVGDWGWMLLQGWLGEWRCQRAPKFEGAFFPSSRSNGALASSSLSETTKPLIDYLKQKELLHESFTFHATRKTYATHYIEQHGTNVDALLDQCGWASAVQLSTYVKPSTDVVERQRAQFARSLGMRRAA
jgi:integrase